MPLQKQLKALVGSFAWAITRYEEWCLSRVTNRFYYWMGINWLKENRCPHDLASTCLSIS